MGILRKIRKYGIYRLFIISKKVLFDKIRGLTFHYLYKWDAFGKNIRISKRVKFFNNNMSLGNNISVGEGSYFYGNGKIKIGNNTAITENVRIMCMENIEIGSNSMIAPDVFIIDYEHNYLDKNVEMINQGYNTKKIIIGDDVWIGQGAIILKGSKINKGCVIGTKSIVKGELEEYGLYVGSPAKLVRKRG